MAEPYTNDQMRKASGEVKSHDPLVHLFYLLARDHLPMGEVEKLVMAVEQANGKETLFTNGWVATYAMNLAERIQQAPADPFTPKTK